MNDQKIIDMIAPCWKRARRRLPYAHQCETCLGGRPDALARAFDGFLNRAGAQVDVATLRANRPLVLREQMSIREIARPAAPSRHNVKKYLRAGEEVPRDARRTSSGKLYPSAQKFAPWLGSRPPNLGNSGAIYGRSKPRECQALVHTATRCATVSRDDGPHRPTTSNAIIELASRAADDKGTPTTA